MLKFCEDELVCDLWQTYQIHDVRALPARLLATLCIGLDDDSRTKRKLSDSKLNTESMLLAALLDETRTLVWMLSKNGQKGRNRPKSVLSMLQVEPKNNKKVVAFASGADFMEAWKKGG